MPNTPNNPYLRTFKPPKESKLDKLSNFLAAMCLIYFLTLVLDLGGLTRIFTGPLQVIFCR